MTPETKTDQARRRKWREIRGKKFKQPYLVASNEKGERYVVRVAAPAFVAKIGDCDSLGCEIKDLVWFDVPPEDQQERWRLQREAAEWFAAGTTSDFDLKP